MTLEDTAARLEALGNPTRLDILRWLVRTGPEGLAVGAIQDRTGIPRSTLSHHLEAMRQAGLIEVSREGRYLLDRIEPFGVRQWRFRRQRNGQSNAGRGNEAVSG